MNNLILVVEDDEVLSRVTCAQLTRLGYSVHTSGDGSAAIEQAKKNNYEMILMDVQMPICDGLEAALAIRSTESTLNRKPVPIVAVSANPDKTRCVESGMNDFLFKPVLIEELQKVLERWAPKIQS